MPGCHVDGDRNGWNLTVQWRNKYSTVIRRDYHAMENPWTGQESAAYAWASDLKLEVDWNLTVVQRATSTVIPRDYQAMDVWSVHTEQGIHGGVAQRGKVNVGIINR